MKSLTKIKKIFAMGMDRKGQAMFSSAQKVLGALIGALLVASVAAAVAGPTLDAGNDLANVSDSSGTAIGGLFLLFASASVFGILVAVFILVSIFKSFGFGK